MVQGKDYTVVARLARGADAKILNGLDGSYVIENSKVSCKVSVQLDSQEAKAFDIDVLPAHRKDDQLLLLNQFTEWDWRVTPLRPGKLHLLLYVTPMLYVDGIGEGIIRLPQPPRTIAVKPDRVYAAMHSVKKNWVIWSVVLTAVVVPALVWLLNLLFGWWKLRKREPPGFRP